MTFNRVIIIGHTGFIGQKVAAFLQSSNPSIEILGFSAPETDLTRAEGRKAIEAALTPNTSLLVLAGIKRQLGDTAEIYLKNTEILLGLNQLLAAKPLARVVYLSSGAVYGEDIENLAITEQTPMAARSYYGLSKISTEFMLEKYAEAHPDTSVSLLRPATIYGPGDVETAYGPSGFLNAAVKDLPLTLWGEGDELRELLHIDDIVALIAKLTLSDQRGPLNLVAGTSYTFQDALGAVERVTGKKLAVTSRARSKPKIDNKYDSRALTTLFPEFRFTPLQEGVQKTFVARYGA